MLVKATVAATEAAIAELIIAHGLQIPSCSDWHIAYIAPSRRGKTDPDILKFSACKDSVRVIFLLLQPEGYYERGINYRIYRPGGTLDTSTTLKD